MHAMKRILRLLSAAPCLPVLLALPALLLFACSDDTPEPAPQGEAEVSVPVYVEIDAALSTEESETERSTRAAPPSTGDNVTSDTQSDQTSGYDDVAEVDQVRLIAFRRRDAREFPEAAGDPFLYDASNSSVVSVATDHLVVGDDSYSKLPSEPDHWHKYAHGTLHKKWGWEYRVVALAYNSQHRHGFADVAEYGINAWWSVNLQDGVTRFEDLQARVSCFGMTSDTYSHDRDAYWHGTGGYMKMCNKYMVSTPQIFWGECRTQDSDSPIIRFWEPGADDTHVVSTPLRAVCLRGMAKVEVYLKMDKISNTYEYPTWALLMVRGVRDVVGLTSYDDFNSPSIFTGSGRLPLDGSKEMYTAVAYAPKGSDFAPLPAFPSYTYNVKLTAWLLPGTVWMGLRTDYRDNNLATQVHYKLHAALSVEDRFAGNCPIGVIDQESSGHKFVLKRNHKYQFFVNSFKKLYNDDHNTFSGNEVP